VEGAQAVIPAIIATLLLVFTFIVHRRPELPSRLMCGAVAALAATSYIRLPPAGTLGLVGDVAMRVCVVIAQCCAVLLVLSFRKNGIPRSAGIATITAAVVAALVWLGLLPFIPTCGGFKACTGEYQDATDHPALFAYLAVFTVTMAASATIIGIGCIRAIRKPASWITKLALVLITASMASALLFVASTIVEMIGLTSGTWVRTLHTTLFGFFNLSLFVGLFTGLIGRVLRDRDQEQQLRRAEEITDPLWGSITKLVPEVILRHTPLNRSEVLVRRVIETHDALKLLHADHGNEVSKEYTGPHRTAAVLLHLIGEAGLDLSAPPEPARLSDESVASSVEELRKVRAALATAAEWWRPVVA
jgi:hypothetical protein